MWQKKRANLWNSLSKLKHMADDYESSTFMYEIF